MIMDCEKLAKFIVNQVVTLFTTDDGMPKILFELGEDEEPKSGDELLIRV